MDGDHLPWRPRSEGLSRLAEKVRKLRFLGASLDREWVAWQEWRTTAEKVPALRPHFQEREQRSAYHPRTGDIPIDVHVTALRKAGFRDVGVIWQEFTNRILFARR